MTNFAHSMMEARHAVPEAFDADGRLLSPIAGSWKTPARWFHTTSPIDGSRMPDLPSVDLSQAASAVEAAADEFAAWSTISLSERSARVASAVASLRAHRDLLVAVLAWEIGKTRAAAETDVDRSLGGIEWYLGAIGPMVEERTPLGLVSNLASWNYPFSVLLLNVVVQALAGNSVIAKIPTQGGGVSLTLAFALLRREGLPVSLVGGRGAELTEALVGHSAITAVAFVGGRTNGASVGARLRNSGKRYALEMEGVNAYAITHFSDWEGLAKQIRAGFDFGKQRCTAYTRWVVERSLVSKFVDTYVGAVSSLRVGHPFGGAPVDFGPLISAAKATELYERVAAAKTHGARILYNGTLAADTFSDVEDTRAYFAPTLLTGVRAPSDLYFREPFGPIDLLVPVGSDDELVVEANVSRGALVASVATDDPVRGAQLAARLDAFKVGINKLRSRGDKEEAFGGTGHSWEGAFVGGANLVHAFTDGERQPEGNFPRGSRGSTSVNRQISARASTA